MKSELAYRSAEDVRSYQAKALQQTLQYLKANSPFYQRYFAEHDINVNAITELSQLAQLPTISKDDLQQHNSDFFCVPRSQVAEYVTTSGTLGEPITFILTEKDLERLAYNEAVSLTTANGSAEDVYQLILTMDKRFMAGLAYYLGARKMGAGTVRVGAGEPQLQWDSIERFEPTALVVVPSFLLKMLDYADAHGIDYNNSPVKKAVCIGEPIREQDFSYNTLGRRITERWNIELYSTYASTEMSTAFTECEAGMGGHQIPDLIITELLDDNDQPVAPGQPGEVTITTLGLEGMPLLRFKTGDICYAYTEPCSCGRTSMRLGPIVGRKQHMIKLKGTTLYPETIFNALNELQQIENYQVEVYSNDIGTDELLIRIGVRENAIDLPYLEAHFKSKLRVTPHFELESPETVQQLIFPAMSRKTVKFIDKRAQSYAI